MTTSNAAAEYTVSNDLKGSDSMIDTPTTGTTYILSKKGNDFGFFKYTGASIPAHKAYLHDASGQARELTMVFGDEASGIVNAEANSSFFTLHSSLSEWYSLDGRRLNGKPMQKGIFIHNGRKEVLK